MVMKCVITNVSSLFGYAYSTLSSSFVEAVFEPATGPEASLRITTPTTSSPRNAKVDCSMLATSVTALAKTMSPRSVSKRKRMSPRPVSE